MLRIWTGFVRKSPWETLTGLVALSFLPVLTPLQGALQEWKLFLIIHLLFAAVLVTMLLNRSACGTMMRRIAACQLSLTTTSGIFCGAAAGILAFLQLPLSAGVRPVILAASSFAADVVISILKAGVGDHLQRKTRYWWQAMQNYGHQSGDVSPEVH